jgi:uncharacterized protein YfaP (DUF2135 family)
MNIAYRFILIILLITIQSCGGGSSGGETISSTNITLSWDAPNKNNDLSDIQPSELVKYRLYYGNSATSLSNSIEFDGLANPNSYTVAKSSLSFISSNVYYLALSVVNDQGVESDLSEIITYTAD